MTVEMANQWWILLCNQFYSVKYVNSLYRTGRAFNMLTLYICFFFQAEDGIRDLYVTGVQTCALPIYAGHAQPGESLAEQEAPGQHDRHDVDRAEQHALGQRDQREEGDPHQELGHVAADAEPQPRPRRHVLPARQAIAGRRVARRRLERQLAAGVEHDVEQPETGNEGGDGARRRHGQAAARDAAMPSKNAAERSIRVRRCLSMVIMW